MKVMGIDYGEKRVGVAVSDPMGSIAMPLKTLNVRGDADALDQVCAIVEETEAEALVIGMPYNMSGSAGPMAQKVAAFVESVRARVSVPVSTTDERLSSQVVERVLLDADMSRGKRKGVRDKLAAQVILQGYLDRNALAMEPLEFDET